MNGASMYFFSIHLCALQRGADSRHTTLALQEKEDTVSFFNDQPVGGSLTMTSVMIKA